MHLPKAFDQGTDVPWNSPWGFSEEISKYLGQHSFAPRDLSHILSQRFFPSIKYKLRPWDIPGGPVVKTLLPSAGGAGSFPGRGTKNPHAWRPKTKT